jgi:hypothetical protein
MGTTNRDASRMTQIKQSKVLYGYYNTVSNNATNLDNGGVRKEQNGGPVYSVVLARTIGACPCSGSNDTNPQYDNNPTNCG